MIDRGAPFSQRSVTLLIVLGVFAFIGALTLLVLMEDRGRGRVLGPTASSTSAVGYHALAHLLDEFDIPSASNRIGVTRSAARTGLLVMAEPILTTADDREAFKARLARARNVLVVLPKWRAAETKTRPDWVVATQLRAVDQPASVLAILNTGATIRRAEGTLTWQTGAAPAPTFERVIQLVSGGSLRPIIRTDAGVLFGAIGDPDAGQIYVLSDPDILANHGIRGGANAALALRLIELARVGDGPVVFDETIHGFTAKPNLWRGLLELPFAIVTIAGLLAAAMLVWATVGRFGAPQPVPPALPAGKAGLIHSTAELLVFGRRTRHLVERYFSIIRRDVARRLHAPRSLRGHDLTLWLDAAGQRRSLTHTCEDLERQVGGVLHGQRPDDTGLAGLALRIYRWRRAMLDGFDGDRPVDGRSAA